MSYRKYLQYLLYAIVFVVSAIIVNIASTFFDSFVITPWVFFILLAIALVTSIWLRSRDAAAQQTEPHAVKSRAHIDLPSRDPFVDRPDLVVRLIQGIASKHTLLIVHGPDGLGKTALTKEVAWRIAEGETDLQFDYVLWEVCLQGSVEFEHIRKKLLEIQGYAEASTINAAKPTKLGSERILLFIDNCYATETDDLKEAVAKLSIGRTKIIVVTNHKTTASNSWSVEVGRLNEGEARSVIASEFIRLGWESAHPLLASRSLAEAILEKCDRSPARIKAIMAQVFLGKTNVKEMQIDEGVIPENIWEKLKSRKTAHNVFIVATRFQSPPTIAWIMEILKLQEAEVAQATTELENLYLLETGTSQLTRRLVIPSRIRNSLLGQSKKIKMPVAVQRKFNAWFGEWLAKHAGLKNWAGYSELDEQFLMIRDQILDMAASHSRVEHKQAIAYWMLLDHYLSVKNRLDIYLEIGNAVMKAARAIGDSNAIAALKVKALGFVYLSKAKSLPASSQEATHYLHLAKENILAGLRVYEKENDKANSAIAYRYLGDISFLEKDVSAAESYYRKSIGPLDNQIVLDNLGASMNALGLLEKQKGNIELSMEYFRRRLALASGWGNPEGEAVGFYNLGRVYQSRRSFSEALPTFLNAFEKATKSSRTDIMASAKLRLAECYYELKEVSNARSAAVQAEGIFASLGQVPQELKTIKDRIAQEL